MSAIIIYKVPKLDYFFVSAIIIYKVFASASIIYKVPKLDYVFVSTIIIDTAPKKFNCLPVSYNNLQSLKA